MKNQYSLLVIAFLVVLTATPLKAQDYRFGKVSKEEIAQTQHPTDPTANAAILYREVSSKIEYSEADGFFLATEVFERIKIYKKEGFNWASKKVTLYQGTNGAKDEMRGLKAYTYFINDKNKIEEDKLKNEGIFEEEVNKYRNTTTFTMPNLKEGCVIEYKYTVQSPFLENIDEFKLQENIPVDVVNVKFTSPEYLVYQSHKKGWIPFDIKKDGGKGTITFVSGGTELVGSTTQLKSKSYTNVNYVENIYKVDLQNVPAIKEEAFSGNVDNYAASLKFELSFTKFPETPIKYYTTSWEDVSATIYDEASFGREISRSNYFEEDVDNLLKNTTDEKEKMAVIHNYVKNKMNWNGYFSIYSYDGVKEAYKKGSGSVADINLMLISMLRYAGLNANPVLLSTKSNGTPLFATKNGFNYVIAAIQIDDAVYLADSTNKKGEIDLLEPEVMNWQGRLIREDRSSDWVSLRPKSQAVKSSLVNVALLEDLKLSGTVQNRLTGQLAMEYRKKFTNLDEDQVRKNLEKERGQAELSNILIENLEKAYTPVSVSYDFETMDAAETIGDKIYLSPLFFIAIKENPFKAEERNAPIDFQYPVKNRYLINITIPEGYKVESIPENAVFKIGQDTGEFKYLINQAQNQVKLSIEFSLNESLISPAAYADIKKFYQLLIDKESEKVILSKV